MDQSTILDITKYVGGGGLMSMAETLIAPPRQPRTRLLPGGAVIGMVWSALFACFGVAHARLRGHPREQHAIDVLWLLCVAYPLYTGGMRSRALTLAGNAVVGAAAVSAAAEAGRVRPDAGRLIWPAIPWVIWATIGVLAEPRRR